MISVHSSFNNNIQQIPSLLSYTDLEEDYLCTQYNFGSDKLVLQYQQQSDQFSSSYKSITDSNSYHINNLHSFQTDQTYSIDSKEYNYQQIDQRLDNNQYNQLQDLSQIQEHQCQKCNQGLKKPLDYSSIYKNYLSSDTENIKQNSNQVTLGPEEQALLEKVIFSEALLPVSRNYYQMFINYESRIREEVNTHHSENTQEENQLFQCQKYASPPLKEKSTPHLHSNNIEEEEDDEKQIIIKSNKKNIVKNIMSAFKNFLLDPLQHKYEIEDVMIALKLFNKSKADEDKLEGMQTKFRRYIISKNFNHYTVKLLIQHPNYSPIFQYFLNGPINIWITSSKVADVSSHKVMIEHLKTCFEDESNIDLLKRHEKKRPHFQ